jgi:hypothetical protein
MIIKYIINLTTTFFFRQEYVHCIWMFMRENYIQSWTQAMIDTKKMSTESHDSKLAIYKYWINVAYLWSLQAI